MNTKLVETLEERSLFASSHFDLLLDRARPALPALTVRYSLDGITPGVETVDTQVKYFFSDDDQVGNDRLVATKQDVLSVYAWGYARSEYESLDLTPFIAGYQRGWIYAVADIDDGSGEIRTSSSPIQSFAYCKPSYIAPPATGTPGDDVIHVFNIAVDEVVMEINGVCYAETPQVIDTGAGRDLVDLRGWRLDSVVVATGAGDDTIYGGDSGGRTYLIAGEPYYSVKLSGGDGRDLIVGGESIEELAGGAGPDTLYNGGGDDLLWGGGGNDDFHIVSGTANGGNGNDRFFVDSRPFEKRKYVRLWGNAGNDRFYTRDGLYTAIDGGSGADWIELDKGLDATLNIF